MESEYEIIDGLTLRTDLSQVDSCASKGGAADVMCILLLFVAQGFKVRLDGKRYNSRWVIGEILLDRGLVELLEHLGKYRDRFRSVIGWPNT